MMKNLIMAVALTTALMGASVAFAEDASQSLSFEDAEKMEQMSEQDKQQKGAGVGSWVVKTGNKIYQSYQKSKYVKPTIEGVGGATTAHDIGQFAVDHFPRGGNGTIYNLRNDMNPNAGKTMPPMQIQIPVRR
jgi:hypothetical protein